MALVVLVGPCCLSLAQPECYFGEINVSSVHTRALLPRALPLSVYRCNLTVLPLANIGLQQLITCNPQANQLLAQVAQSCKWEWVRMGGVLIDWFSGCLVVVKHYDWV